MSTSNLRYHNLDFFLFAVDGHDQLKIGYVLPAIGLSYVVGGTSSEAVVGKSRG